MKNLYLFATILVLGFVSFAPDANAFQDKKATGRFGTAEENKQTDDGKISFTFKEQDWEDVIPWFADQAGYSLQPVSDWPEGTFNLTDRDEYSVLEALDQLNNSLRRLAPEPYTLIRTRKMLTLAKLSDSNFPDDLIEVVKVEDLDSRGKYETIRCIFDLGDLNAEDIYDQIIPMVSDRNRGSYAVFPAANQIHVRESGVQLRAVRDLIKVARDRMAAGELDLKVYTLKHQDSESFMMIARGLLGMPEGRNTRDDNELAIAVEPFGDRLFVQGTKEWLKRFEQISEKIDISADDVEVAALDEPKLKQYPVLTDPKQALLILDTMLEGREGVKMGQDEVTGAITILGREADHAMAQNTLDTLAGAGANGFALIQLESADPVDVIMKLQSLFRQSAEDDSGPVMLGDSDKNQIIVRGTPQEVSQVKLMVAQMEENAIPTISGSRSDRRIIPLDDRQQERIMPMLEDLLGATNRRNQLKIVLPEDRKNFRNRFRTNLPNADQQQEQLGLPGLSPEDLQMLRDLQKANPQTPGASNKGSQLKSLTSDILMIAAARLNPGLLTSFAAFQEDEVGSSSEEGAKTRPEMGDGYMPPPQVINVPNDPIEVKFTEYGVVLTSRDLDALDDLEYIIGEQFDTDSAPQAPSFFYLKHRGADEVLSFLETYFGIADSGGGGGGGNIMGSMMSNMMGGGGDLLGGLLGGDSGTSAGILEGDVNFGVDMRFNALYVRGATDNDFYEINSLIDMLDQPEAPHDPDILGVFRTIDVNHRDATELKDIILEQLADLIDSGEQGGANKQANEMAQMAKMMQSITGGKGKGTDTSDLAEQRPKVKLGVDESSNQILVTGPEYIYKKILDMVEKLDRPGVVPELYSLGSKDAKVIKSTLKAIFGDKIEIVVGDGGEGTSGSSGAPGSTSKTASGSTDAAKKQAAQGEAIRNAIMSQMRSSAARQGGGATRGGGGATRGGGGGGTRGGGGGRGR